MAIETGFGSLEALLTQQLVREVPLYQRRYTWERKDITILWEDIRRLYALRMLGQPASHFIGSVILGEQKVRGPLQPSVTPIIDGQQRLLTISLILALMCDTIVEDSDAETIRAKYLVNDLPNSKHEPRIAAGRWDAQAYQEVLRQEEFSDTDSKIREAYEILSSLLALGPQENSAATDELFEDDESAEEPSESPDLLEDWDWEELLTVITRDLEFAVVSNVPETRAYEIFQTLNSLGTPLSQVDLARNALFVALPHQAEALYRKLWLPMEQALPPEDFEDYLHCWVTASGQTVNSKSSFTGFLQILRKPGAGDEHSAEILQTLHRGAADYLLMTQPTDADLRKPFSKVKVDKDLVNALARLRDWGSRPLEPAIFIICQRVTAGELKEAAAIQMLGEVESLLVRRYICQIPPNDLRSSFVRVAHTLAKTESDLLQSALRAELLEPSRRWPTDREVLERGREAPLYRKNKPGSLFFILTELARRMQGREVPAMTLGTGKTDWSIEHILPQKLTAEWRADLKSWGCKDPTDLQQRKQHVIGNLTVTVYNSDLKNKRLKDQQKRLKDLKHNLVLSQKIMDALKWNERTIDDRSKQLLELAIKIWDRPKQ